MEDESLHIFFFYSQLKFCLMGLRSGLRGALSTTKCFQVGFFFTGTVVPAIVFLQLNKSKNSFLIMIIISVKYFTQFYALPLVPTLALIKNSLFQTTHLLEFHDTFQLSHKCRICSLVRESIFSVLATTGLWQAQQTVGNATSCRHLCLSSKYFFSEKRRLQEMGQGVK